jgi:hypothetical protein
MTSLKFGLNLKPGSKRIKSVLEDDEDEVFGSKESIERALSSTAGHSTANTTDPAEETEENMYDAVYDDLKRKELLRKKLKDGVGPDGQKKARYMQDLINASAKRKLMLEKQREKKIEKERETELELYGEKEEFVTEAYKLKKLELKKLEEEERRRDAIESDPNRERDITGFYRGLLNQVERASGPLILGDQSMAIPLEEEEETIPAVSNTNLNDNEEIIDKRELLKGGLNINSKALKRKQIDNDRKSEQERQKRAVIDYEKRRVQEMQKERNRLYVEHQKVKIETEKLLEKQKEKNELVSQLTSSTAKESISDAKARYLARKAQK